MMRKLLLMSATFCFTLCILLVVWFFVSEIHFLEEKYRQYIEWLLSVENRIAGIENKWLIVLVVELLYLVLTTFPVFPGFFAPFETRTHYKDRPIPNICDHFFRL